MDAPAHFKEGGKRIHEIKFEDLIGPAVKIDLSERAKDDIDTTLTVQDLKDWEKKHGKIPNRAVVLLYTGQSKVYEMPGGVFPMPPVAADFCTRLPPPRCFEGPYVILDSLLRTLGTTNLSNLTENSDRPHEKDAAAAITTTSNNH